MPNDRVQTINGKTYKWQPDLSQREQDIYQGREPGPDDWGPDEGPGSWVPASYSSPNGLAPWKIIAGMAAAGAGGQLLAAGIPALVGGGTAAGASGAVGAGTAGATGAGVGAGAAGTTAGTGGFLSGIGGVGGALNLAGKVGSIASAASQGRSEGRAAEADYLLGRDRLDLSRSSQERGDQFKLADLDLARRQQGDQLDASVLKRAIQLGLLGSNPTVKAPDFLQGHMGTITGFGPQGVQGRDDIIAAMRPRVMDALEKGQQYSPLTLADLPQLSTPPQPGKADKALNYIGTAGTLAGLLGSVGYRRPAPPQTTGATPTQLYGPGGGFGGVRY